MNSIHMMLRTRYSRLSPPAICVYVSYEYFALIDRSTNQGCSYDMGLNNFFFFFFLLSRGPPPAESKPEAINLQSKTYSMSEALNLFQPPESYPPETKPEPEKLKDIFPWERESRTPKPTRVFLDDDDKNNATSSSHKK